MALYKFTNEEVDDLKKELENLKQNRNILNSKTGKDLWNEDLDKLIKIQQTV